MRAILLASLGAFGAGFALGLALGWSEARRLRGRRHLEIHRVADAARRHHG